MTEEKLQKALEIQDEIRCISCNLERLEGLNQQTSANVISVSLEGERIIDLHLNDACTHEILEYLIRHFNSKKMKKMKEFEAL